VTDHVAKPIEPERLRRALLRWIKPQDQASSGASKTARQAPGSNLPVIDEALLDRLEGSIGKPSVADLAWLYLDTTGERLAALDQALARHDAAAVRQEAHDLKSTSGNLGASQLFAQVRALERAAKTAAFDEIALLAAPVRDQFEAVRASFEARYPR
jgi:HPt (histidine-containing phosphotransfer) domain-containing protein